MNVLRAVLCLCILVKHFSTADGFAAHWPWWAGVAVCWVPGTECFLVVSGYFLAHMFRPGGDQFLSLPQFARRRVYRLVVPYWVALGLAYVGLAVWRVLVPAPTPEGMYAPTAVLANFLCVPDVFSAPTPMLFFWTVVTLVQVYATWSAVFWCVRLFFLVHGAADYHHRAERLMIWFTGAVLVVVGAATWGGLLPAGGWALPKWSAYPAMGAFAYWTVQRRVGVTALPLVIAFVGVGAAVAGSPRPFFGGVTGLLLVAAARGVLTPTGWVSRALSAVGNWSYSIYLVHGLVGVRLWAVLAAVGVAPRTPGMAVLLLLATIAASVFAGWLLYLLVERPMSRRSARVPYRRAHDAQRPSLLPTPRPLLGSLVQSDRDQVGPRDGGPDRAS